MKNVKIATVALMTTLGAAFSSCSDQDVITDLENKIEIKDIQISNLEYDVSEYKRADKNSKNQAELMDEQLTRLQNDLKVARDSLVDCADGKTELEDAVRMMIANDRARLSYNDSLYTDFEERIKKFNEQFRKNKAKHDKLKNRQKTLGL